MNPSLGSLGQLTVCFSFDSKTRRAWTNGIAGTRDKKLTNISDMALSSGTYIGM